MKKEISLGRAIAVMAIFAFFMPSALAWGQIEGGQKNMMDGDQMMGSSAMQGSGPQRYGAPTMDGRFMMGGGQGNMGGDMMGGGMGNFLSYIPGFNLAKTLTKAAKKNQTPKACSDLLEDLKTGNEEAVEVCEMAVGDAAVDIVTSNQKISAQDLGLQLDVIKTLRSAAIPTAMRIAVITAIKMSALAGVQMQEMSMQGEEEMAENFSRQAEYRKEDKKNRAVQEEEMRNQRKEWEQKRNEDGMSGQYGLKGTDSRGMYPSRQQGSPMGQYGQNFKSGYFHSPQENTSYGYGQPTGTMGVPTTRWQSGWQQGGQMSIEEMGKQWANMPSNKGKTPADAPSEWNSNNKDQWMNNYGGTTDGSHSMNQQYWTGGSTSQTPPPNGGTPPSSGSTSPTPPPSDGTSQTPPPSGSTSPTPPPSGETPPPSAGTTGANVLRSLEWWLGVFGRR